MRDTFTSNKELNTKITVGLAYLQTFDVSDVGLLPTIEIVACFGEDYWHEYANYVKPNRDTRDYELSTGDTVPWTEEPDDFYMPEQTTIGHRRRMALYLGTVCSALPVWEHYYTNDFTPHLLLHVALQAIQGKLSLQFAHAVCIRSAPYLGYGSDFQDYQRAFRQTPAAYDVQEYIGVADILPALGFWSDTTAEIWQNCLNPADSLCIDRYHFRYACHQSLMQVVYDTKPSDIDPDVEENDFTNVCLHTVFPTYHLCKAIQFSQDDKNNTQWLAFRKSYTEWWLSRAVPLSYSGTNDV